MFLMFYRSRQSIHEKTYRLLSIWNNLKVSTHFIRNIFLCFLSYKYYTCFYLKRLLLLLWLVIIQIITMACYFVDHFFYSTRFHFSTEAVFRTQFRCLFRTQSNIYDRTFCDNNYGLKAVSTAYTIYPTKVRPRSKYACPLQMKIVQMYIQNSVRNLRWSFFAIIITD